MKLVTFRSDGGSAPGLIDGDSVVDLSVVAATLIGVIERFPDGHGLVAASQGSRRHRLAEVTLLAPIPAPPRNIFCIGKNYRAHIQEFEKSGFDVPAAAVDIPEVPIVFTKAPTTVIGPGAPILGHLDPTGSLDYEGELAVVIGKGGRGIARRDAPAHVFGYTIINDVTSRKIQQAHKQWFLGKSIDSFCPMGPTVVTAEGIGDPAALRIITRVNGEVRQDGSVADLIFDIPTLIETISRGITLLPGDVIATGTPDGVGAGFYPPKFLKAGDRVEIIVDPIGTLSNPVA